MSHENKCTKSHFRGFLLAIFLLLGSAAAWATPVDVNSADAAALAAQMTGVGLAKAEAIVAYRDTHGPFKTVDELIKVKGIGPQTVEKNRADLMVENL
ncbi:MAG: competence protein ComEA [Gammaproteobacteria bacterium]|nr:competence protein ComEA [Gammaproteobacteria bacterium]